MIAAEGKILSEIKHTSKDKDPKKLAKSLSFQRCLPFKSQIQYWPFSLMLSLSSAGFHGCRACAVSFLVACHDRFTNLVSSFLRRRQLQERNCHVSEFTWKEIWDLKPAFCHRHKTLTLETNVRYAHKPILVNHLTTFRCHVRVQYFPATHLVVQFSAIILVVRQSWLF